MTRRLGITGGVLLAGAAAIGLAAQQPSGEPFSTAIRPVRDGLYVIPGYDGAVTGGNVAVRVTGQGVVIVDDRLPPQSAEIADKVRSVTSQPIRYVMSTHHHGDHSGGHAEFVTTAEIIGHRNNRVNMVRGKQAYPPRLTFIEETSVFLGGAETRALYYGQGHTNGDAVIYFPDLRVIHTGDLVVWGQRTDKSLLTPFVDRANGGSLSQWLTTLDRVLALDFDAAIPGHGPVLTKDQVRTFRRNLETLRQRVTAAAGPGVSRADFGRRLQTADLSWPFPEARLDDLFDEFGGKAR
jgi:glyoxylase-like metal-dependent hydrolase (beta-lactamase superfamily II)